jgi:hypothetical protein
MNSKAIADELAMLQALPEISDYQDQPAAVVERMKVVAGSKERYWWFYRMLLEYSELGRPNFEQDQIKEVRKIVETIDVCYSVANFQLSGWLIPQNEEMRRWIYAHDTTGYMDEEDLVPLGERSQREDRSERMSESPQRAGVEYTAPERRQRTRPGSHHPSASGSQRTRGSTPSHDHPQAGSSSGKQGCSDSKAPRTTVDTNGEI